MTIFWFVGAYAPAVIRTEVIFFKKRHVQLMEINLLRTNMWLNLKILDSQSWVTYSESYVEKLQVPPSPSIMIRHII